jgi:hypothetical protein
VNGPDPEPGGDGLPDLEALFSETGQVLPGQEQIIMSMTAVHAVWYRAWQAAGIPEERAYGLLRVIVREGCRRLSWVCSGPEIPAPGHYPPGGPMPKEPLPEPVVPWWVLAAWNAWGWVTWPLQARQLRRAGFRRTGWRTWEAGPDDPVIAAMAALRDEHEAADG